MPNPNPTPDNLLEFASFSPIPKIPPQNIEVEEAILGAILLDPEVIARVADTLTAEAFYLSAHQTIYKGAIALYSLSKPTDLLSLVDWLTGHKLLDKIGGQAKLVQLLDRCVTSVNADAMAALVMDKHTRRRLLAAANDIQRLAHDGSKTIEQVADEAEQLVYKIAQIEKADLNQCEVMSDITPRLWEQVEAGKSRGIQTGFLDLDAMTGGFYPATLTVVAARTTMGKALPLDAKIVTPDGWKLMRDIKIGDLVAGSDGNFYPVTGVFPQGVKQTYRVELNDGTVARCCADHLWFTATYSERKAGRPGSVKSLREIMQAVWTTTHKTPRLNHQIPMPQAVNFTEKVLPIHPYLLGLWLGDGSSGGSSGQVEICNPEQDIQSRIKNLIPPSDNIRVHISATRADRVMINGGATKLALKDLRVSGLCSHEKFIPEVYKIASVDQRFSLLAGLLDTDGHVVVRPETGGFGNYIEYCTTSERLRDDVIELIRSLGGRATFIQRMGAYRLNGERTITRLNYRIFVSFPKGVCPVTSQKHLAKYINRNRPLTRTIQAIIPDAQTECQCISVDSPNHLFLTDDYIPTHNTQLAIALTYEIAKQGLPVVFFTCEMSKEEIANRLLARIAMVDSARLREGDIRASEWEHLAKATGALAELPIYIHSASAPKTAEMRSVLRRVAAQHDGKLGLVILDYIQLLGDGGDKRVDELDKIVREFRGLANDFNVPCLGLAQINRGVEGRDNKRPRLSDIRECGGIENHADVVLLLYRDEYYNTDTLDRGIIELDIAKNRNRQTGMVRMLFAPEFSLFRNLAKRN